MTRRAYNQNLVERYPQKKKSATDNYRRPFWLSASIYYALATTVSLAVFFIFLGISSEGATEAPLAAVGIFAALIFIFAVILREVVLRKSYNRFLSAQERLESNFKSVRQRNTLGRNGNKLTLEQNATILKEIERKSEAARVLGKLPNGHFEVFEMCQEYLERNGAELKTIGNGSPRLKVLRRSREKIKQVHKYHLLAWAAVKTRSLTQDAKTRAEFSEKLEDAQRALDVLESARKFYPEEPQLTESVKVIDGYIVSIKVSHSVELAEKAAFKGSFREALNYYQDALFFLAREKEQMAEKDLIRKKINFEIKKLEDLLIGS